MGSGVKQALPKMFIPLYLRKNVAAFVTYALVPPYEPQTDSFTCIGAWAMEDRTREGGWGMGGGNWEAQFATDK